MARDAFTLVEMAMVVLIIGLVMLTIFPALTGLRAAAQRSATEANMQSVMRAIAIFAQNNGCLPCPTPANATTSGFGQIRGDNAPTANPCGNCANPEGIPPFIALGIPQQQAKDGWGRWLTLRIDPNLAVDCANKSLPNYTLYCSPDTTLKGLCASGVNKSQRLMVRQINTSVLQPAAVMLVSHGANGFGAFVTNPRNPVGTGHIYGGIDPGRNCGRDLTERCNYDGDVNFLYSTPSEQYDDLLLYYDRNNLVSLFGTASCPNAW